ncbi:bile acid:sodium symporter family protein [Cellulomonas xylanilytica]|uniref:Transporter n=1 Tax=Cellulomonas xylanilytica TaxID=233583 RepID=A0A510V6N7_9CELL|nr:bile acid:sodium symporter [Cellulomonas xylanilytica]GEK20815.1 transporter [Cellulomonas xylanilytica]
MSDALLDVAKVAILTFVLASMVALGLSLTVRQIVEPLRNARLVVLALVSNFVVAPAVAWGLAEVLGLDDSLTLGLLLLGTAAGAPFLPKLAQLAKGDVPYSVGLMILLMVVTIPYVPLVLGWLAPGLEVGAWDIAKPLVFLMLLPLAVALAVRARYDEAKALAAPLNTVGTVALALGLVLAVGLGLPELVDSFGTGAFVASALFVVVTLVVGYLIGGSDRDTRVVSGLGAAQRNLSAALLIATTSFTDQPEVLVMVMVGAVLIELILLPVAAELGRRAVRAPTPK